MRVENRRQHQRLVQQRVNALFVRFDAHHAVLGKRPRAVSEQRDGLQHVLDNDRLKDVQLELALRARESDRRVVTNDLCRYHGERFALSRVHL